MRALVLTPAALFRLSQFSITKEWFERYGLPEGPGGLKRVVINDIVYIVETEIDTDTGPIVVLDLDPSVGIFVDQVSRTGTLDRIITVARSVYTDTVSIPTGWRAYHEGQLLSIQAPPQDKNWRARLHFVTHAAGASRDLFAFARTEKTVEFSTLDLHDAVYRKARNNFTDAVLSPVPASQPEESLAGIKLSQRLPQGFVQGATLEQWYKTKLTAEQRTFVDKKHDGPVRLRGAAGTGKTLSLVVKFLRDAMLVEAEHRPTKLGFITHSFASADLVGAIGDSLDIKGLLHGGGQYAKLHVRTIYDLAHSHLNFSLDKLEPLSLDGREGRRLQAELITDVLKEMKKAPIVAATYSDISVKLAASWDAVISGSGRKLVSEIMNEFASVLDAEAIRAGEEKGERYAKSVTARPAWLMGLPKEDDRRFILEAHRRYRKLLGEMSTISVDQMIGDFNSFLDSNRWDRIRSREGYDVLFVDELHLFTSIERQTLHKLIKRNVEEDGRPVRPPIFMAYDLKQSPRDTFAQYGDTDTNLFGASTGLQGSELVRLERVFRYTPQIAEFLADLDSSFPAIDIPGEWEAYAGKAQLEGGEVPTLTVFKDERAQFAYVMREAERLARKVDGGGRRIAVLCASDEMFDTYVRAAGGQFEGKHISITSREPSSELRHAGKRFILSMPEYVAGLQFETVFLINVDAAEAPRDAGDGVRRRFISGIYLGSSRAEKTLNLSACLSRGGKSDVLDMALQRRSLNETAPPATRRR
ncbi:MAG: hypothetical protein ABS76_26695 [Pelagibacterium sp. SCN 64-44]|nr:MAG: hypothetical protein ABS76_26695 [Pelagibacterium sp. SCN 64-44]